VRPASNPNRHYTLPHTERVLNIHVHTTHSDGTGSHAEIARQARAAGIDVVLCADHNTWPKEEEGWKDGRLILVGEEVHAPSSPLENHLLVFGADTSLAPYAENTQGLLDAVRHHGGLAFLAHPYEHSGAYTDEPEINWTRWDARGYTGIELWNYMSEFKSYARTLGSTVAAIVAPRRYMRGPYPETLRRWQNLLADRSVVAIAGSDAHAGRYGWGPLKVTVLPYRHLFRALNTHVLLTEEWSHDAAKDADLVYDALRVGRAFLGYDGLAPTSGFRFEANGGNRSVTMGGELAVCERIWLRAKTPSRALIRLFRNGQLLAETRGRQLCLAIRQPGRYHVETFRRAAGAWRHWIIANPIRIVTSPP
jgi:hypothetical protein